MKSTRQLLDGAPIPAPKVRALHDRLEADESVAFNTGAKVEVERWYRVTTPLGAVMRFTEDELGRAYALALRGVAALPQPTSQTDFGDDPPF